MPINNNLTTLGLSQCQVLEKKLDACLSFLSWDFFCLENEYFLFFCARNQIFLESKHNHNLKKKKKTKSLKMNFF
jgi:hypothetical protein